MKRMQMKQVDQTLVIITPGFPGSEADSTCLPAQQTFIRALNNNFPDLKIIIVSLEYPFLSAEYEWHGNRVIPLNGWNKGKIVKLRLWWRAWKLLKKLKTNSNIVGLFSFWCAECALIGKYFGERHHLKHYTWILGQDARKGNRFIRWIRPRTENLVAMSGFLAGEFLKNHGIRPAHIIPNGIDISLYPVHRPAKDIDILGAGSLIPLKQYDVFIQVVKELSHHIPAVKSVICGKGPEEHDLLSKICKPGLQNNISLVGEKPHGEVLQWMCRARVFLHTSSYEGFSSVCLEALYAGAQVISFCDPMAGGLKNWHIAANKDEMVRLALMILQDADAIYEPVLPYSMDDNAKEVMKLFGR
jgi:glycosyltransferase involved in cell wall biosynthesis